MIVNIINWADCRHQLKNLGFFTEDNINFTVKENEPNILTEDEMWDICKKIKSSGLNLVIFNDSNGDINICVDTRRFTPRV